MALSISPSLAFVQDPEGKTHVLLFNPQDSIAKNLMRHSSQLHLPPLMELYILSGSHIIQADRTGTENGLHQEPHLKILLRCRGGMRGGSRGSPQGGPWGKGRGHRSPEGDDRQIGRSHGNEDRSNHTTPPGRGGRGRGRGNLPIEHRRPTLVHTAAQEPIDANRLNASLKATQETHCNMMILHCRQSWEESEMTIGHGPTPTTADRTMQHGEGPAEQQKITPLEPKQHTTRTATARQLKMDSTQDEKITTKGRGPVKSKGEKGMENNPHKKTNSPTPITTPRAPGASQHSQKPAQGREVGRAKERMKHPARRHPWPCQISSLSLTAQWPPPPGGRSPRWPGAACSGGPRCGSWPCTSRARHRRGLCHPGQERYELRAGLCDPAATHRQ